MISSDNSNLTRFFTGLCENVFESRLGIADPPLVDEARAAWLRHYADKNNFDLEHSYGYGDSHADLVWLQLLGNPSAVNPDIHLYRHAREKHWNVIDWKRRPARHPRRVSGRHFRGPGPPKRPRSLGG